MSTTSPIQQHAAPRTAHPVAGIGQGIRRHPFVIVLCVILFVGAGIAGALVKKPTYKAQATLSTGRIDVGSPGDLSTFATATQSLAEQYARTIQAQGVVVPLAQREHLDPGTVRARLNASPVPSTPVLYVTATGPSKESAVRLANDGGNALISYTTEVNRANPDGKRLFQEYATASANLVRAQQAEAQASRNAQSNSSAQSQAALVTATTARQQAQLQVQSLSSAYQANQQSQATTSLVQMMTPAESATNNRSQTLQMYGFAGLAAGLAVGLALATLLANRDLKRRVAA
jgi:capsular polysaccharide biosynthesis protein